MVLRYAEIEVPRYTSYPTAAQFHGDIDDEVYRTWLVDVPSDEPLSKNPYEHQSDQNSLFM